MTVAKTYTEHYGGVHALVLGASGFIGRWVARYLCHTGAQVSLLVRNKATAAEIFQKYAIDGAIYEADLRDSTQVRRLYAEIRPTITFNLAGYGVDRTERDEEVAYQMNHQLVEIVCAAIAEVSDPAWLGQDIVHVGSALEYGAIPGDLAEDSRPNPTTLYGQSKLAGTLALTHCCHKWALKGITARLFTVYGPGEHRGRLLPSLLEAAQTGERVPLTMGTQQRDFVYVEDVAKGLLQLGLASTDNGVVVNVATGVLCSVREFVETASHVLGIPNAHLDFGALPSRSEEMEHLPVALERLVEIVGWRPDTQLVEGIRKTMVFERKRMISHDFVQKKQVPHLR